MNLEEANVEKCIINKYIIDYNRQFTNALYLELTKIFRSQALYRMNRN